jgi:hypothetical protein
MTDFDPYAPRAIMHMTMDGRGVMCGADLQSDDDGAPAVFALPGVDAEPTAQDRDVEAARIFNEVQATGWTPELEQAAERLCYAEADGDHETFALRNQQVSHQVIGNGSPYVDDELARAKAEAQAEENERAAKAAPQRQELLDEYERGSVGHAYPFKP